MGNAVLVTVADGTDELLQAKSAVSVALCIFAHPHRCSHASLEAIHQPKS